MKKLMIAIAALTATAQALAMPTREDLSKAQPLVNELMTPALEEYRAAKLQIRARKELPALEQQLKRVKSDESTICGEGPLRRR